MREKDYKGKGKRAQVKGDIWVGVGNEFDEALRVENHRVALIDVSQAEKQNVHVHVEIKDDGKVCVGMKVVMIESDEEFIGKVGDIAKGE